MNVKRAAALSCGANKFNQDPAGLELKANEAVSHEVYLVRSSG